MSRPMLSEAVKLTKDILQPDRKDAVMTIYEDKLTFDLQTSHGQSSFKLHNPKLSTLPNLETMIILCSGPEMTSDVYVFTRDKFTRRYCLDTLHLLGFEMLDCYRRPIPVHKITYSTSLPAMPTILELE